MKLVVVTEPHSALVHYSEISIAFTVDRVLEPVGAGLAGIALAERRVAAPYRKDYDSLPGAHPSGWAEQFKAAHWTLLVARQGSQRVGGAMVIVKTPTEAALWDIRVAPDARGQGVGSALFAAAKTWAAAQNCPWLVAETQNINVGACQFYAKQGGILGAVHRFAYPELPDETQILWYFALSPPATLPP